MATEHEIQEVVGKVMTKIRQRYTVGTAGKVFAGATSRSSSPSMDFKPRKHGGVDSAFDDPDAAVKAAREAQRELLDLGLEKRFDLVAAMRKAAFESARHLGELAVRTTGLGKMPDKQQKVELAAKKTPGPEIIHPKTFTGDAGLTLVEKAPYGVMVSITPTTNPPSTVVNNAISMVSAGNAVVINPHPTAKEVSCEAARILQRAVESAGGPKNLICAIGNPSQESGAKLMNHPGVDATLVTGGREIVRLAMSSGKKVFAAGPGNPPVVVDETCILPQAARDTVFGAQFDNCVLCTGEKEIFCVASICDAFKSEMEKNGSFEVKGRDLDRLVKLIIVQDSGSGERHPRVNKELIGKDASKILAQAGIRAPLGTRHAFLEVDWDHPMVMAEQLMPVTPIVRCKDYDQARDWAVIAEHRFRHTFTMHSTNIARLSDMARACNANIFVKNGPSLAGLGFGGEGFTTLSIAGWTGEG
ncbi:aldehyde dehydrogenase, partial [bacterium]|nr:aldehyde dehydrogenase [bacterium]